MARSPSGSLGSRRWEQVRKAAKDRDGWRCTKCGRPGVLEVHHVVPVHERPDLAYSLDNVRTLCRRCHIETHRRPQPPDVLAWRRFRDSPLPGEGG